MGANFEKAVGQYKFRSEEHYLTSLEKIRDELSYWEDAEMYIGFIEALEDNRYQFQHSGGVPYSDADLISLLLLLFCEASDYGYYEVESQELGIFEGHEKIQRK